MSRLVCYAFAAATKIHSIRPLLGIVDATNQHSRRTPKKWYGPSIRELNKAKAKYADKLPKVYKRSGFIDWNFNAEIYSFGMRLNENFDLKLLERAFVQRSYVVQEKQRLEKLGTDASDLNLVDNSELVEKGRKLTHQYVEAYLRYHLPQYPDEGIAAVQEYLLSTNKLAYISSKLGSNEIILAEEYPPAEESLAHTILAVIGALEESQSDGNLERPYNFIRDFICTQLNQRDINEIWKIENPFELLKRVCAQHKIQNIEARIIGNVSKRDILACCRIGIYDSDTKKLLGNGFGDTYENGIETASIDALSKIFGTFNLRPFDFTVAPSRIFNQQQKIKQISN